MEEPDEALDSQDGACNRDTQDTEQPLSLGYPGQIGTPGHVEAPSSLNGDIKI